VSDLQTQRNPLGRKARCEFIYRNNKDTPSDIEWGAMVSRKRPRGWITGAMTANCS